MKTHHPIPRFMPAGSIARKFRGLLAPGDSPQLLFDMICDEAVKAAAFHVKRHGRDQIGEEGFRFGVFSGGKVSTPFMQLPVRSAQRLRKGISGQSTVR